MVQRLGWALAIALTCAACGDEVTVCPDPDEQVEPSSVEAEIDEKGGVLELPGKTRVEIPAGALDKPTTIKVSAASKVPQLPLGLDPASKAYAYEPHGIRFKVPVKIKLSVEGDTKEVLPAKLADAKDKAWKTVVEDVSKEASALEIKTTTFSFYMAVRPRPGSGVVVLPDGTVVLPGADAGTGTDEPGDDAGVGQPDAGDDAGLDQPDAGEDAGPECDPLVDTCPTGAMRQLVAGYDYLCALYESGVVYCWGANGYGELGQATQQGPRGPGLVEFYTGVTLTNVESISAHPTGRHVCALRGDGSVACWGDNAYGKAGASAPAPALRAYPVPGVSGAVHVAAGGDHSCAVLSTGRVLCWGLNSSGQLGTGNTNAVASSSAVPMLEVDPSTGGNLAITDAVEVVAGQNHTCVLHSGRQRLSCTGQNTSGGGHVGMLGRGLTAGSYTSAGPALLPTGLTVRSIYVGSSTYGSPTCVVATDAGAPVCWGMNDGYMLASSSVLIVSTPSRLDLVYAAPKQLAMGHAFTCVSYVHPNFGPRVACQGYDSAGQLGRGVIGGASSSVPTDVMTSADPVSHLDGASVELMAAGRDFVCVKRVGAGVSCWGGNGSQIRGSAGASRPYCDVTEQVPNLP